MSWKKEDRHRIERITERQKQHTLRPKDGQISRSKKVLDVRWIIVNTKSCRSIRRRTYRISQKAKETETDIHSPKDNYACMNATNERIRVCDGQSWSSTLHELVERDCAVFFVHQSIDMLLNNLGKDSSNEGITATKRNLPPSSLLPLSPLFLYDKVNLMMQLWPQPLKELVQIFDVDLMVPVSNDLFFVLAVQEEPSSSSKSPLPHHYCHYRSSSISPPISSILYLFSSLPFSSNFLPILFSPLLPFATVPFFNSLSH